MSGTRYSRAFADRLDNLVGQGEWLRKRKIVELFDELAADVDETGQRAMVFSYSGAVTAAEKWPPFRPPHDIVIRAAQPGHGAARTGATTADMTWTLYRGPRPNLAGIEVARLEFTATDSEPTMLLIGGNDVVISATEYVWGEWSLDQDTTLADVTCTVVFDRASVAGVELIGNGTAPFSAPVEVATFGDSYVAGAGGGTLLRNDYRGPWHWANHMLGAPMRIRREAQRGFTGWTIEEVWGEIGPTLALDPKPKLCFLASLGHNDATAAVPIATSRHYANLIVDALNRAGIIPVAGPVLAKDTFDAEGVARVAALNAMWLEIAEQGRIIWADWSPDTVDPTTGLPLSGVLFDETHPGSRGAYRMSKALAAAVAPYLSGREPLITADNPGLLPNALNSGSSSYSSFGFSGTVATGLLSIFGVAEASGTKVCSKVARTDGGGGDWQQIALTDVVSITPSTGYQVGLMHVVNTSSIGLVGGEIVEGIIEYELDGDVTNVAAIYAGVQEGNVTNIVYEWEGTTAVTAVGYEPSFLLPTRGVIRTPAFEVRPPTGAHQMQVRFGFQGDTVAGPMTATGRFMATLRRVS